MQTSDFIHLSPDVCALANAPDSVRFAHIVTERYIYHRRVEEILNHVEYLMLMPRQTRAWGLTIVGGNGSGKTSLAEAIKRRLEPKFIVEEGNPQIPIVMISMTNAREARTIYNRIFEELGITLQASMRNSDREQLALRLLRQARTKLILVDEIQDVLSSTKYQQRLALDTIKLIMNSLGMPIVTLGVESASEAMSSDAHLRARFDIRALPMWGVDADTRGLLQAMEKSLPLKNPSNLASPSMTKLIVGMSKGSLSKIVRLVNHAAVFAIIDGRELIDKAMLEAAEHGPPPSRTLQLTQPKAPEA